MRLLILIFFSLIFLNAETFFDRFKKVESALHVVEDDVKRIKTHLKIPTKESKEEDKRIENLQDKFATLATKVKTAQSQLDELLLMYSTLALQVATPSHTNDFNTTAIDTNSSQQDTNTSTVSVAPTEETNTTQESPSNPWGDEETPQDIKANSQLIEEIKALENFANKLMLDIIELKSATNGNHIKTTIDFRTAVDSLQYKMANGTTKSNPSFLTNRLRINLKYRAHKNMVFIGQLAYHKHYGARQGADDAFANFSTFDWVSNQMAYDDTLRVRQAYFLYFDETLLGIPIQHTFSIGRRPSTNGLLINLRDDDSAQSPLAHAINVEFDGLSVKFDFSELSSISGLALKFCYGRGLSNAHSGFNTTPHSQNDAALSNIDLVGVIATLYNDGTFTLASQGYFAQNLLGFADTNSSLATVGNMASATLSAQLDGLFEAPFFDSVKLFASASASQTRPHANKQMLGLSTPQLGYSVYGGIQIPSFGKNNVLGFEFNKGSQYWRSITYAEDTMIGSKIAARGDAYEAYYTHYFLPKIFSAQLRYTYIDYAYNGSNGFFGTLGAPTPISSNSVDSAQDMRLYFRYRY